MKYKNAIIYKRRSQSGNSNEINCVHSHSTASGFCISKIKFKWQEQARCSFTIQCALLNNKPSVWASGAHIHVVDRESAGILRRPVSEEELLCLALQGLLAFFHLRAGLVHHQAHASCLGEVVLRPVGRPCEHRSSPVS